MCGTTNVLLVIFQQKLSNACFISWMNQYFEWLIFLSMPYFSPFVCIYLPSQRFTSSSHTTFTFFREVAVKPWPIISSHISSRTSGTTNLRHHLLRWIKGHLEWEHICRSGLYVDRPSSRLRNWCITGQLRWEHIRSPNLCLYVLMQDELGIISASRWNQPSASKRMTV